MLHTSLIQTRGFKTIAFFLLALVASAGAAPGDDGRAGLLAEPQFVDSASHRPSYSKLDAGELRESLVVVAGRTHAYYGFNNPEIQVHLPWVDNSTLAEVEMPKPRLLDDRGREVAYQLERGLHDVETQIAEIRFLTTDGESPASFARAVGEISIRYPLTIETLSFTPDKTDPRVRIDGPYVDTAEGFLPETAPFADKQPLRAFDAQGRQLQPEPVGSPRMEGDKVFRRLGFHGRVARVEIDRVTEWAGVTIGYDVPIAPPLADKQRAVAIENPRDVKANPQSRIEIEVRAGGQAGGGKAAGGKAAGGKAAGGKAAGGKVSGALSASAQNLAEALRQLREVMPEEPSIVSAHGSPRAYLSISVDIDGEVKEWSWNASGITGPTPVSTEWLQCKNGLDAGAFDLGILPKLFDQASAHIGEGSQPLQFAVGQSPCGTAFVYLPFEGGKSVQFDHQGHIKKP